MKAMIAGLETVSPGENTLKLWRTRNSSRGVKLKKENAEEVNVLSEVMESKHRAMTERACRWKK